MRAASSFILLGICLTAQSPVLLQAADLNLPQNQVPQTTTETPLASNAPKKIEAPFNAFTGKVIRNKVRLRIQANLDSPILRELNRNDMVIVVGESDDFYAVQPPADVKGYVYRTFVLDDVVEGERVNVRLEPDLASPIIAQLSQGERVKSTVSSLDKKWLEISPPNSTRFFVCKDYVEKIGDPTLMSTIEKRREEVTDLLNEAYLASQTELQKPYEDIHLDDVTANLNRVVNDYADFPAQSGRAKEILASNQATYLLKKVAYMEAKFPSQQNANTSQATKQNSTDQQQNSTSAPLALATTASANSVNQPAQAPSFSNATSFSMTRWNSLEQQLYEEWKKENPSATVDDFYQYQLENAVAIQGIIEPYTRTVKNKPGDYLLVNQANHLPIAYLYSSKVNLEAQVGHEVTIHVSNRDNHNFAFPAYFVLSID